MSAEERISRLESLHSKLTEIVPVSDHLGKTWLDGIHVLYLLAKNGPTHSSVTQALAVFREKRVASKARDKWRPVDLRQRGFDFVEAVELGVQAAIEWATVKMECAESEMRLGDEPAEMGMNDAVKEEVMEFAEVLDEQHLVEPKTEPTDDAVPSTSNEVPVFADVVKLEEPDLHDEIKLEETEIKTELDETELEEAYTYGVRAAEMTAAGSSSTNERLVRRKRTRGAPHDEKDNADDDSEPSTSHVPVKKRTSKGSGRKKSETTMLQERLLAMAENGLEAQSSRGLKDASAIGEHAYSASSSTATIAGPSRPAPTSYSIGDAKHVKSWLRVTEPRKLGRPPKHDYVKPVKDRLLAGVIARRHAPVQQPISQVDQTADREQRPHQLTSAAGSGRSVEATHSRNEKNTKAAYAEAPTEWLKCARCPGIFKKAADYKQHIRKVHGPLAHDCELCAASFKFAYELKQHTREMH